MKPEKQLRFADATLSLLEKTFNLRQDFEYTLPAFLVWQTEAQKTALTETEVHWLKRLQAPLRRGASGWNEVELESKFIAPLFGLADFDDGEIGYFMERQLEVNYNNFKLYGTADGLIAKGVREPELPYFCMQEFKRSQDHSGSADGQALAAMLATQQLNQNNNPVYGLYVVGVTWYFMVLEEKTYVISKTYAADGEGIEDIFKMLKALKVLIGRLVVG